MVLKSPASNSDQLKVYPPQIKGVDDQALWENIRQGNDLAFSMLYNRYVRKLYSYGMNACKNRDMVLDCLQELFGSLWEKQETLSPVVAVNSYLHTSFRRLLTRKLSSDRKLFKESITDDWFELYPSAESEWVDQEFKIQKYERLNEGVMGLTKRQREAILLRYFSGLEHQEVAEVMGMKVESVYNVLSKAIELLRKKVPKSILSISLWLISNQL